MLKESALYKASLKVWQFTEKSIENSFLVKTIAILNGYLMKLKIFYIGASILIALSFYSIFLPGSKLSEIFPLPAVLYTVGLVSIIFMASSSNLQLLAGSSNIVKFFKNIF